MKKIIYAFLLALLACAVSYVSTNKEGRFAKASGEKQTLKYWQGALDATLYKWFPSRDSAALNGALFINVGMDLQLVERKDECGRPIGNAVVTNRDKLYELLGMIQSTGNYKYLMLDVRFEEGYETDADSLLFSSIASMDRIVIPNHHNCTLADSILVPKAAYADYHMTLAEDGFTKYPLLSGKSSDPSLALKMYSDITGRTVRRWGPLYVDGRSLSRKSVFPKMYVKSTRRSVGEAPIYWNMGSDILDKMRGEDYWEHLFDNKIIIIGSFEDNDLHETYTRELPGCVIHYNAFLSLVRGHHRIPVWMILLYFSVFFVMSLLVLCRKEDSRPALGWLFAKLFVIYSIILIIICIIVFTFWNQAHDIFITSTLFSIIDICCRWLTKRKKMKEEKNA